MSSALVLVVLIAGRDDAAASEAAVRAARAALPADAALVVKRVENAPLDDEAVRLERTEHAEAIAIVAWTDGSGRRVRLRMHRSADGRWMDRDIAFEGSDASAERGRTLGFALASMMPDSLQAPANAPSPTPAAPTPAVAPPPPAVPAPAAQPTPHAAIDAAALGALGIDGFAGGVGARAGAAWLATRRVGLRVDGSVRRGEVAPAQVSSFVVAVGPGVSIDVVPTAADQPVGFGIRLSGLAILHSHSHLSNELAAVHESRWLPGASGFFEGLLRLSDGAALLVSGGSEVAFGQTDVYVEGRKVAVIPPVRLVADAGIRVRF